MFLLKASSLLPDQIKPAAVALSGPRNKATAEAGYEILLAQRSPYR
jgi:hypothetical protein